MTTELTDREYSVMRKYRGGVIPTKDDREVLNELTEKGLIELHHQTQKGMTIPYYDLSFRGLRIFEEEKVRRSPVTSLLRSIFQ